MRKKDFGRGDRRREGDWFATSCASVVERAYNHDAEKIVLAREMNNVDSALDTWWHEHCTLRDEVNIRSR